MDDPAVVSCVVNRAFAYGTARPPSPDEFRWLVDAQTELMEAGVTWRALMRRIAQHPQFYTNVVE